jgi:ABC-2 type transport system permease protein
MTAPNRATVPSAAGPAAASAAPIGNIYDLGYRHYEGKRYGRAYAMWSLFVESFRGVWGLGRPLQAKAAPFLLAGFYALPALVQLAFSSVFAQRIAAGDVLHLLNYHNYFADFYFLVFLFCVAQAPELVCRDQRYQVLPLYFTRAMGRMEYALARLASLAAALFILLLVPALALFVGDVLMQPDAFKAIGDELPKALPSIPASALMAAGLAALSLAVSSFSPRRAYSAIGIVAYILLMESIPAALYSIGTVGQDGGSTWMDKLFIFSPITSLIGGSYWFFGQTLDSEAFQGTLTSAGYLWASIASVVVMTGVLMYRYRRIPA